jgi:tagatose 1,6-diphosphate aldolase
MPDEILSIGKARGLDATATSSGVFAILAFDHRQSFVRLLNPTAPEQVTYAEVVAAKSGILRALAPHASAALLDPVYGAAQAIANGSLPGRAGLLVAIEETGYAGTSTARVSRLLEGWSIPQAKRMGIDGVKFLVHYHPGTGALAERMEILVGEVIRACQAADLTLYLEPVSYSLDPANDKNSAAFAVQRPGIILEIARRLGALGPDVLKLEFPADANYDRDEDRWQRACEAISQAVPCPWAVLSAGVDFEVFARQVEIACRAGASGYIAGRSLWKEALRLPPAGRQAWLETVAAVRLDRLTEIAERYARPWRSFHPSLPEAITEDWYLSYSSR